MEQIDFVVKCSVTSFDELDEENEAEELEALLIENGYKRIDVSIK